MRFSQNQLCRTQSHTNKLLFLAPVSLTNVTGRKRFIKAHVFENGIENDFTKIVFASKVSEGSFDARWMAFQSAEWEI